MSPKREKSVGESSGELPDWISEIRQEHYAKLAQEHRLTEVEIQRIHEATLQKLASIEPKFQMYIEIALPKAIEEYKKGELIKTELVKKKNFKKICPECEKEEGVREIIWGMPDGKPDESKFYIGGCTSEDFSMKYKCIKCGWEGKKLKRKAV